MTATNQRTRRSALNFISGLCYTAVTMAIAFFTTPLLLRWLGVERYGAARAVTDWFGQLGILEMGLMSALPALLARSYGTRDDASLYRMFAAGIRAYARILVLGLIGGLVITFLIPRLVPVSPALAADLRTACFVALLGLLLFPALPFRYLFDAEQRGYVVSLTLLAQSMTTVTLSLLLARAGWGITGQLLALSVGQVLHALLLLLRSRARIPRIMQELAEAPDPVATNQLRALNWPSLWFMLAGRIGLMTDNIVVAGVLGPSRVAPLYLTQRLVGLAGSQLLALGGASWAALAELHATGRRDDFNARLLDLTRLVAGLAVATLVPIAAFNHSFVVKWIGVSGFGGDAITILAALNCFLLALVSIWSWVFSGTGVVKLLVPSALASSAINIAVSIGATAAVGLPGPLIGTLVGVVSVSLWYVPLMLERTFGTPLLALARAASLPLVWGLPIGAGLWWFAKLHPPESWLELLVELAVSGLVLLTFWWVFALTKEERDSFRARLGFALG